MPLGVQRCYVFHSSEVEHENGRQTYDVHNHYGTSRKSLHNQNLFCGDSVRWKPMNLSKSSMVLGDSYCAVKISLTKMNFLCCCYSNGKSCEVGLLAANGLTCPPELSMHSVLTVDEREWSYVEDVENSDKVEIVKASDLILQPKCYMEISVIRSGRAPKLNTSIALINGSNENENCYQMFQKIPKNKNCITYERQCYTDIEDELFYCCRFQHK